MKMPEEERKTLGFLLPDLLGKPLGLSDKEGNLVFPVGNEIPPNNFIFAIPVSEWEEITRIIKPEQQ